jgi:hypothetical protein
VKVASASGITNDGLSDPSLQLFLLRKRGVVAQTAIVVVITVMISSISSSYSRDALGWCRGISSGGTGDRRLVDSTSCYGGDEEFCCSISYRRRSYSSSKWWCSLSK